MSKNKTPLDEFAKLLENPSHNLSVDVYNENVKVIKEPSVKKHNKDKMTLAKLSTRIDDLSITVNDLSATVNNLAMTVSDLAKEMRNGFKQVNSRIDNLETRIDRIEVRLDGIDARLDYNGLKKLPNNR